MYNPELIEKIEDFLTKSHQICWVWEEDGTIKIYVVWGDWKHNHFYVKHSMNDCFGLKCVNSEVTAESGSDAYCAVHTFVPQYRPRRWKVGF